MTYLYFMKNLVFVFCIALVCFSCNKENVIQSNTEKNYVYSFPAPDEYHNQNQFECLEPSLAGAGQIFHLNNKAWLWGGLNIKQAFDVSNWSLKIDQLGSGLGRETIESLVYPQYDNENPSYKNDSAILVETNDHYKAYPLSLMIKHEVINDEIDGVPVLVAYCPLANLAIVYERKICNSALFFAASGYTYVEHTKIHRKQNLITNSEGEVQSFILWDRNTESLWYPLMDVGVSGKMLGKKLKPFNKTKWKVVNNLLSETERLDKPVKILGEKEQLNLNVEAIEIISITIDCEL